MHLVFYFLLFSCCIVPFSAEDLNYYAPSDDVAIDCSPSNPSSFSSSELHSKLSTVSKVYALDPVNRDRPRISACIFRSQFTYTFSVSIGPKFVRLYFIPMTYSGLNLSNALFTVTAGSYTLLTASESSYHKLSSDIVREFCINSQGELLNVTFTPLPRISGAYAFVNKIEIVSMPSMLYVQESMEKSTALETMYRVNIGGDLISSIEDNGMSRVWGNDVFYFMSSDDDRAGRIESEVEIKTSSKAAPNRVYSTARTVLGTSVSNYSLHWSFPVESGFNYFARLHFCEISSRINQDDQRVFRVDIANRTVEDQASVFNWTHGVGRPIFRDYMVNFSRIGYNMKFMTVSIRSNNGSFAGPILNGLEIFKLSDFSNNLAGKYPFGLRIHPNMNSSEFEDNGEDSLYEAISLPAYVLGWGLFAMFPVTIVYMIVSSWRRASEQGQSSEHCRIFSISEIKAATNNFSDSLLIGSGGFGMVYKGSIDGGINNVAIKRANPNSHQGLREFQTEISMLSKLRHKHLVSLIGYAAKGEEMILVYDYMAQGTLRDHLYRTQKPPLLWKQRLRICIGAARGLHYLHTGTKNSIIHRDVKTSNILLDNKLVAKVADFGLSSALMESKTHVSTIVKGTFGYLDPEYYRRQKLTEKSDVYSFGVVLSEVLCGRPAVLPIGEIEDEENERVNLAEWVLNCYKTGSVECIIDPKLKDKIGTECFKTFSDVAVRCLADKGSERPSMGEVLCSLELAMQQQNATDMDEDEARSTRINDNALEIIDDALFIGFVHSDGSPGVDFSDLMFPTGR